MPSSKISEFPTYRAYVAHVARQYPEYRWLERFLDAPGRVPSDTQVHTFDFSTDGTSMSQDITAAVADRDRTALREALSYRGAGAAVRVVVMSYGESWGASRDAVDVIGSTVGVDPLFFWSHFQSYYSTAENLCPADLSGWGNPLFPCFTEPLPSQHRFLQVNNVREGFSALFLHDADGRCTVLVLCRSYRECISGMGSLLDNADHDAADASDPRRRRLSTRYRQLLRNLTADEVQAACKAPVDFAYPYLRVWTAELNAYLQDLSYHLESQYAGGSSAHALTTTLEVTWARLHDAEQDLRSSIASLTHCPAAKSPNMAAVAADCAHLLRLCESVLKDLRDYIGWHVGMKSLEESRLEALKSRRAIQQADGVNRLQILAAIFIPLNLVTSLFGMNLVEFGSGTVHFWIFVVVAVVISLAVGAAGFAYARRSSLDDA